MADIMSAADKAMYMAKENGRDQIVVFENIDKEQK